MSVHPLTAVRVATVALVLAGLAACSSNAGAEQARSARPSTPTSAAAEVRPTASVDRLVPVGPDGGRLHLVCEGAGDRTVVLIAGFGGASTESWTEVAPDLASDTRVCAVDRFGLGSSDAPSGTQTFATQAHDLHLVLDEAGEPGLYIVVGHSFGGAEAVAFTAAHQDEVDGLVLVDASPTAWPEAACAVPDPVFVQTCASFDASGNAEHLDVRASFAAVAEITDLGSIPLRVLTRADVRYPDLTPADSGRLAATWRAGQERWASLSTDAQLVPVVDTGHVIQHDQPNAVLAQIRALI